MMVSEVSQGIMWGAVTDIIRGMKHNSRERTYVSHRSDTSTFALCEVGCKKAPFAYHEITQKEIWLGPLPCSESQGGLESPISLGLMV